MRHIQLAATAVLAMRVGLGPELSAQASQPTVREVLKTGTEWVSGVAEPASGRFIVYADSLAIKIYNRKTQKSASVPVTVYGALGGGLSISRSGRRLIFPVQDDAKHTYIWSLLLDTLTGTPAGEPHRVSIVPARMASISGDGRWIALMANDRNGPYRGAGQRLLVIPSDGGIEKMLDSGQLVTTPRWSPDGKSIFYSRGGTLARIAASGGKRDSLGRAGRVIGVAPDGKHVAVIRPRYLRATQALIEVVDFAGNVVGGFSFNKNDGQPYGWAHNGARLLGSRFMEPATLKTVRITDGAVSTYPVTEAFPLDAHFSPDGSRLAMISRVGGREQFVIYDVKTRRRSVLSTPVQPEHDFDGSSPWPPLWHWSPDGSRIAFFGNNASSGDHELFVADVTTGKTTHLANLGDATLYRWRSDGKAIDFLQGHGQMGRPIVAGDTARSSGEVDRVTMSGAVSRIRALPPAETIVWRGSTLPNVNDVRLINDTLLLIGRKDRLDAVPLPSGEPRTIADHMSFYGLADQPISPDGKWIAVTTLSNEGEGERWTIVSTDGKAVRHLASPMGCRARPAQWLPDSRGFLGIGLGPCDPYDEQPYVVPTDGGPAWHVVVPPNQGYTLTPDGHSLLVAADDPKIGSIVEFDLTKLLGSAAISATKPAKDGKR